MTVRRICESHRLKVFDGFASGDDDDVPQETQTIMEKDAQGEKKPVES